MYEVSVEREFCAAHALVIGGEREAVHWHDFHVMVTVGGRALDGDGLLVDFHELERVVDGVIGPLRNVDLGKSPAFLCENPSAEVIATHIATAVAERLSGGPARVRWVRVTEAPGCSVTYRPE